MSTDARAIVEAIFFSTSIPMGGASACVFYMTDMWNVGVTLLGGALVLALRAELNPPGHALRRQDRPRRKGVLKCDRRNTR